MHSGHEGDFGCGTRSSLAHESFVATKLDHDGELLQVDGTSRHRSLNMLGDREPTWRSHEGLDVSEFVKTHMFPNDLYSLYVEVRIRTLYESYSGGRSRRRGPGGLEGFTLDEIYAPNPF